MAKARTSTDTLLQVSAMATKSWSGNTASDGLNVNAQQTTTASIPIVEQHSDTPIIPVIRARDWITRLAQINGIEPTGVGVQNFDRGEFNKRFEEIWAARRLGS